jgi:hypothetical protein
MTFDLAPASAVLSANRQESVGATRKDRVARRIGAGRARPSGQGVLPAVLAAKREAGVVGRRRTALFAVVGCAKFHE